MKSKQVVVNKLTTLQNGVSSSIMWLFWFSLLSLIQSANYTHPLFRGGFRRGSWGLVKLPFTINFLFSTEILDESDKLEIPSLP